MKIAKILVLTLLALAALVAFGWFFVSQLGSGRPADELSAVVQAPPEGYALVERGSFSPTAAAAELETQVLRQGGKVGIRFEREGADVYWLADVPGDVLEERSAGASGTRLQTYWRGGIRERLRWARVNGNFDAPGLSAAERKNLFH